MNKTEQAAFEWLQKQGHTGIVFRARETPDFITDKGLGFEVKRSRNSTIWFGPDQADNLCQLDNISIIVMGNGPEPEAVIPFKEITGTYWKNINIQGLHSHINGLKVTIILPDAEDEFWRKVKSTAALRGVSVGEFAQTALKRAIQQEEVKPKHTVKQAPKGI